MKAFILNHKVAAMFVFAALVGGGWYAYSKSNSDSGETRYITARAEKGTLIVAVDGSGQVSSSNQVDVKPKVSGDVTTVAAVAGKEVKAGALLVQLDTRDAQKAVRDAETSLETARLTLDKLMRPPDALALLQSENSLIAAKESKAKSESDLVKSYEDGFNTVSSAFLDLPGVMTGLSDIIYGSTLSPGQWNISYYYDSVKSYDEAGATRYRDDAENSYKKARASYDKNFGDYKSSSRFSDSATVVALIDETYATAKDIAEAVKNTSNFIQFYEDKLTSRGLDPKVAADTALAALDSYTGTANSHLSGLLSASRSIQNAKDSLVSADRSIAEREGSLADLKSDPDTLDVRSLQISIQQRQNELIDAREKLAETSIRAPFDGVIAKVSIKKGDAASAGSAVVTLIAKQRIAEISLNEVDAARIKAEQKATLTFDAVEGLSLTGQVMEVDALGTVSQGVVTYNVKIAFDAQDDRIKPGMSVSAAVIVDVKPDALLVPAAAVKSSPDGGWYVETLEGTAASGPSGAVSATPPQIKTVEVGVSNDTETEIMSGLKGGDLVVTRTVDPAAAAARTQTQSLFPTGGRGGAGASGAGGAFRVQVR